MNKQKKKNNKKKNIDFIDLDRQMFNQYVNSNKIMCLSFTDIVKNLLCINWGCIHKEE